jgi:phosphohistidine phosphatase SixA
MRRRWLVGGATALLVPGAAVGEDAALVARLRAGGLALLMRHAQTGPGTGDPPGFRLDDCATQRNLDERGRAQARAWGEWLRAERVPVDRVLTSAWCRCVETAELMAIGAVERFAPLDSFFEERARRDASRAGILAFVRGWQGPGNVLMVTHQVNVTAVTGVFPRSGAVVAVEPAAEPRVLGTLQPPLPA